MTYQFAHELCHILCGYDQDPHPNRWFEESLCEAASLFVLRRSAETWKTRPPYPNWKDYAKHLRSYADDRIKNAPLPEGKTLAAWYRENAEALAKNAEDRPKNSIVAGQLLPLLEEDASRWESIAWLNTEKMDERDRFRGLSRRVAEARPERHAKFIARVAKLFEVELK